MRTVSSIKFRLTVGVFVLAITMTVLFSGFSYMYEKKAIQNRVYEQLNSVADLKKGFIVNYLGERINDLKTMASSVYQRENITILLNRSSDNLSKKAAYQYVRQKLNSFKNIYMEYDGLEIVDLNGDTVVSSDYDLESVRRLSNQEHRAALSKYAEALKWGASLLLQNRIREGRLDILVGIRDEQEKIIAVVIGNVGLTNTLFLTFSDYTGLGHAGETLLVRRLGSRISFINPTRHQPQTIDEHILSGEEYLKLEKRATSGNEGIDQAIDYRGKAVIGAYRYIPSLGWGIVAKIDTDEAFAEITALRQKTILFAIVILAVMLAIVYVAVHKFLSPIIELSENTKAITAGHFDALAKSGRKDEIGELEENFNQMVMALDAARRLAEIKQEELEHKVEERTGNLARVNAALSGALQDIQRETAEKKSLQAQLLHSQKMEAIGTLAGGIAHDFNNILTAIIGYSNLIRMKLEDGDPLREYLDHILTASERAASLTHSLLAFSRKQIINPQPVNLNELVQRVEKLLSRLMGEDIDLLITLSDPPLTVMADPGQIEQVLMNLATNARDAMPAGGLLTITAESAEITEQYIALHGYGTVGKYAVISVSDTGIGIDETIRARIFEPFFTTKETGKGTGLGLSIAYGIIKAQNGYINCYSEPGKGTTFKIYLPLTSAAATRQDVMDSRLLQGGRETILVAEDNAEVRKLARTILIEFGYTVIEAVDGVDAVKKFTDHGDAVRLLLFDIIMPRKNGKDAYEEIRKIRPGIKVIFMSGYTADISRRRGFLDEGLVLLTKPLSPQELLRKIREVLDGA